jgi:hypothetical protein
MSPDDDDDRTYDYVDYGLPPRPPSPSLLNNIEQHPQAFYEAPCVIVPLPNNAKIKKKDEKPEIVDLLDDDDDDIIVYPPVIIKKEEPVDIVELSEESEGEIEVVAETGKIPGSLTRERRERKRRSLLAILDENDPQEGTSSRCDTQIYTLKL